MAKKKSKKLKKRSIPDIKIDQILLRDRQLFLFNDINEKIAKGIVQNLYALDVINHKRIILKINSPGGHISDGIAILDAIRTIKSPVITWITGIACSMAALISVTGGLRVMTEDSIWMAHPPSGGVGGDYFNYERDRMKLLDLHEETIDEILKKCTKLTPKEIMKGKTGELWLSAKECLKKGIVDKIV